MEQIQYLSCPPPAPQLGPWLVLSHEKYGKEIQTFFSISEGKSYECDIPTMGEFNCGCYASSHGWLVLWEADSKRFMLWNSISMEAKELPPFEEECFPEVCILSSQPTDPDCMILLVTHDFFIFCRPGNDEWIEQKYDVGDNDCIEDVTVCRGKLYAITLKGYLAVIDTDTSPSITPVLLQVEAKTSWAAYTKTRLVESCGELYIVTQVFGGYRHIHRKSPPIRTLRVYKMDFASMKWVEAENLGSNRAFFLGDNCTFSCIASEPQIKANSIYYSNDDTYLHAFDVEKRTIKISVPCRNLGNECCTLGWVMPKGHEQRTIEEVDKVVSEDNEKRTIEEQVEKTVSEEDEQKFLAILKLEDKVESSKEGPWSRLPTDILILIQKRLSLKDNICLASVCKMWKSISLPIHDIVPSKFLMIVQGREGMCKFLDPFLHNAFLLNIPEIIGTNLLCSKYGWLLLQRGKQILFFNPFTKAKIELPVARGQPLEGPIVELDKDFRGAYFTSPPTSSDCYIFCLMDTIPGFVDFCTYRIGDENWTISINPGEDPNDLFDAAFTSLVHYGKYIFFLGQDGKLGFFDLEDDSWGVIADSKLEIDFSTQEFLMESEGELLSVYMSDFGKETEVYSFDFDTLKWTKVESWGGQMFSKGIETNINFHSFQAKQSYSGCQEDRDLNAEYGVSIWFEPSF